MLQISKCSHSLLCFFVSPGRSLCSDAKIWGENNWVGNWVCTPRARIEADGAVPADALLVLLVQRSRGGPAALAGLQHLGSSLSSALYCLGLFHHSLNAVEIETFSSPGQATLIALLG